MTTCSVAYSRRRRTNPSLSGSVSAMSSSSMPTICVARLKGPWSASASRKARSPSASEIRRVALSSSGSIPSRLGSMGRSWSTSSMRSSAGPTTQGGEVSVSKPTRHPTAPASAATPFSRSIMSWPYRSQAPMCASAMARPSVQYSRRDMPARAAAGMKFRRQTGTRSGILRPGPPGNARPMSTRPCSTAPVQRSLDARVRYGPPARDRSDATRRTPVPARRPIGPCRSSSRHATTSLDSPDARAYGACWPP